MVLSKSSRGIGISGAQISAIALALLWTSTARAAPAVEYVRICDAYGAGYFFIPGTDTCLKISDRFSGPYAGVGVGESNRRSSIREFNIIGLNTFSATPSSTGGVFNFQTGYNWSFNPNIVFGAEANVNLYDERQRHTFFPTAFNFYTQSNFSAQLLGRIGFVPTPGLMISGLGGVSLTNQTLGLNFPLGSTSTTNLVPGAAFGAELELRREFFGFEKTFLDGNWSAGLRYLHIENERQTLGFTPVSPGFTYDGRSSSDNFQIFLRGYFGQGYNPPASNPLATREWLRFIGDRCGNGAGNACNFGGLYFGTGAGGMQSHSSIREFNVAGFNTFATAPSSSGGMFSLYTGYNWPIFPNVVVGAEANVNFFDQTQRHIFAPTPFSLDTRSNFSTQFLGRLGFAPCPNFMFSGLGGLSLTNQTLGLNFPLGSASTTNYVPGLAIGAELEIKPNRFFGASDASGLNNLSFALRYLHVENLDQTLGSTFASPGFNYQGRTRQDMVQFLVRAFFD